MRCVSALKKDVDFLPMVIPDAINYSEIRRNCVAPVFGSCDRLLVVSSEGRDLCLIKKTQRAVPETCEIGE